MKRILALLAAVCLLCVALTGCGGDDGLGKGFRFPLAAEPTQLDPQVCTDPSAVTLLSVIFEGLTRLDDAGNPVPGAATWTVSPDGLTYTFTLRESYWSTLKGTPWEEPVRVVADDFVFGLQRTLAPETRSSAAKTLYGITGAQAVHEGSLPPDALGVKAVSDSVLTITLSAPDSHFLATLATTPCMPCSRAFFAHTAGRYGLEQSLLIGNGPFWLAAWNHNDSLLLYKNEKYHGVSSVVPEAVRFVINPENPASQLSAGTLDAAALQPSQVAAARKAGATVVELKDSVRGLWFNTAAGPMAVPAIRQALRDSVQWDTVYAYLESAGETAAVGFVPPAATVTGGELYRRADNRRPFTTDVETARTALKAGLATLYPDKENPTLPAITVVAPDDETSANLARYIIQSWQKNLNITVNLTTVPAAQLPTTLTPGVDAIITTYTPTGLTGAENLKMFATGGVGNRSDFSDKEVDAAVAAALAGGRNQLDALEERLWLVCPCLPLSYPTRYYGIAANCEGISVRPFGGGVYGSPLSFLQAKKFE